MDKNQDDDYEEDQTRSSKDRSKLRMVKYSEKSVAVFGETRYFKEHLMKLGGRYNPNLTENGHKTPGYVFSLNREASVKDYIETGYIESPNESGTAQSIEKKSQGSGPAQTKEKKPPTQAAEKRLIGGDDSFDRSSCLYCGGQHSNKDHEQLDPEGAEKFKLFRKKLALDYQYKKDSSELDSYM
jgi:hypothetical protein